MSNEELRDRKLRPYQRQIWCDAFKASMRHVSIEGAERKAWQAVDICERVGAFNESQSYPVDLPAHVFDWEAAWTAVCDWLNHAMLGETEIQALFHVLTRFKHGGVSIDAFKHQLQEIYATE